MPGRTTQRALARDLSVLLGEAPVSARPLRHVVGALPSLLEAEQACAFLVIDAGGSKRLEFFHGAQMPAGIRPAYERWLLTAGKNFAHYDPARPDPRQRNVALRTDDLLHLTQSGPPAVARSFLPRFALSESDQLRTLICEGPSLLAWVGAFRPRRFSRDEVRLLQSLAAPLQRRLALERRMVEAHARASEIGDALEDVPSGAFVLSETGAILHANAAGRALLDRDRKFVEERLRLARTARLSSTDGLRLAILHEPADPGPRVALARIRWTLTARQTQVLDFVARGMSNRAIAASLSCAEGTVELHVSALLEKSQSANRAELVARLWSSS